MVLAYRNLGRFKTQYANTIPLTDPEDESNLPGPPTNFPAKVFHYSRRLYRTRKPTACNPLRFRHERLNWETIIAQHENFLKSLKRESD